MGASTRPEDGGSRRVATLCVLAAGVLWLAVKLSATFSTEIEVSVAYELPVGIAFAQPPRGTVTAAVEGSGWRLLAHHLAGSPPVITVDSSRIASAPDNGIAVRPAVERAFARRPLTVRRVVPERLATTTSRVASVRLPVVLRGTIDYAESFAAASEPRPSPDSVAVTGPASALRGRTAWPTDSFALTGVRDTSDLRVALAREPGIRVTPPEVSLQVESQRIAERTFVLPVLVVGATRGDSVVTVPSRVSVSAVVGLADYGAVRPSDFLVVVDVRDVDFGASPARLPAELRRVPTSALRASVRPGSVTAYRLTSGPE